MGGIEFVAVAIGLFGIGEVLANVEKPLEMLGQRVLSRGSGSSILPFRI